LYEFSDILFLVLIVVGVKPGDDVRINRKLTDTLASVLEQNRFFASLDLRRSTSMLLLVLAWNCSFEVDNSPSFYSGDIRRISDSLRSNYGLTYLNLTSMKYCCISLNYSSSFLLNV
jgi:hypothetical protein